MNAAQLLHLYSRAGFGLTTRRLEELLRSEDPLAALFPRQVPPMVPAFVSTSELLKLRREIDRTEDRQKRQQLRLSYRAYRRDTQNLWFEQLAQGPHDLVEKMALFWHGHFACRILDPYDAIEYTNILRTHGLGNFKTLLTKVSQCGAMVDFLHISKNRKRQPNEDFARELCELFTLGRDRGYNETDVKEIARCFTGWTVDDNRAFYFDSQQHDEGVKRFMGHSGNFGGEDVFDILLSKEATARFLAEKLHAYFVHPIRNVREVNELAEQLLKTNYDLGATMRYLFSAPWF